MKFKTERGTELPLINLQGRDYLQVQHRLLWFREKYPSWSIKTEFVALTNDSALAKAFVSDETGRVMSTAHKYEEKEDFLDFREKAETGAIGRALALVGCGTQFALDLDEQHRLVDAPVVPLSPKPRLRTVAELPRTPKRSAVPGAPVCCEEPMMVSRFDEGVWYCTKCRRKTERQ